MAKVTISVESDSNTGRTIRRTEEEAVEEAMRNNRIVAFYEQ